MAPDAEDCVEVEQLSAEECRAVPVHQGRRVLPEAAVPAEAWIENEEAGPGADSGTNSPGENRRLLGNEAPRNCAQAGLTLGVWKQSKCSLSKTVKIKPRVKTKFQKRKEKLMTALRPPFFTVGIILLIVALHLCGPEEWRAHLDWTPGAWWRQPWRLLTYGLVHAGNAHLAINALVALAVGWQLEREQGAARVALVWGGGVVAGALGAGVLQPSVHVVGASAAVYALLTAHLPNVWLRFGHIPLWWFRPLSVVVLSASEAGKALLWTSDSGGYDKVAWAAHVLGAAVGVPLGFVVFDGENGAERCLLWCRVVSSGVLVAGAASAATLFVLRYNLDEYT